MTLMPVHEGACAPAPAAKNSNATNAAVARSIRARRKTASELHDPVVGHGDLRYRVDKLWCNLFEGDNTLIASAVDSDGLVGLSVPVRVKTKSSPSRKKKSP